MFTRRALMAVAMASMSLGAIASSAPIHLSAPLEETDVSQRRVRRRRLQLAPSSPRQRHSRGPQARSKRRRNMVTLSRRVRRRHRRAA